MSHEPKPLPADDRVGTRFGERRIDALIAVGGMASVYRAAAADGTAVALKIVKQDLARDETLRREARIAQTVSNPRRTGRAPAASSRACCRRPRGFRSRTEPSTSVWRAFVSYTALGSPRTNGYRLC
jgi:hypothetical protein